MKSLKQTLLVGCIATCTAAAVQADELRIGFVNTMTGSGAIIGKPMQQAWELALEHLGGKIGGMPTKVIYVDDQMKPDIAVSVVDKLLNSDKVHVVAGPVWTNLMLAVKDRVLESNAILVSTLSGPSLLAGKGCSPYFFTVGFQADNFAEATGKMLTDLGEKEVYFLAPNYQAGKEILVGFERYYKGNILERNFFALGMTDFQAELSLIRAKNPTAVAAFAPGSMGIAFMKQWAASGLGTSIKLYTISIIDHQTLRPIGKDATGAVFADYWNADADRPATTRFVRDFTAKYGATPPFYAAQGYDAAMLIDSGVRQLKGDLSDRKAFALALRKADFTSVRGAFSFNTNHFPVQNWYKSSVIMSASGAPLIKTADLLLSSHKDAYFQECKMPF